MKRLFLWSALTIAASAVGLTFGASAEARPGCGCGCAPCAPPTSCVQYQTVQRTVMVPEVTWETRQVPVTVCRPEVRQQTITVMKPVYELKTVTRTYTVMEVQQRSREVNYTECVPEWKNVDRQITVMVPEREVRQGVRQVCQPYQEQVMQTVCRDNGRWEERQVACYPSCDTYGSRRGGWSRYGGCGGCDDDCGGCGPTYTVCRVWVPNVVQEQVPVTVWRTRMVDEPFQYEVTVCKPQTRVIQERVCEMRQEPRTRTINYTECVPKAMSKDVQIRVCRHVPEQQQRDFTVMVPQTVMKDVQVPVCRMVPKVIECRVPVYSGCQTYSQPACGPCL